MSIPEPLAAATYCAGKGLDAESPIAIKTLRRRQAVAVAVAPLGEGGSDLLHAVDEFDRGSRRQHDAARRIAAAGDGRVGLDFVDARHAELDP
jgi:hypothetical protein